MNAREGSWTGDLLIVDTEDLKTMPPSEIHVKKLQIKRGGHSQEKQRICIPMQDGRNIARTAAVLHRCVQSEGRLRARISTQFFTRKRRSPRSRSTCWSSTRFSVLLWNITYISESRWYENETSCSSRRFSHTSESHWCPETWKRAVMHFKKRPSMTIGKWMPISHCLNRGSVSQGSSCSTKIHQKDMCGFKSDWRRNRSAQDLDILGRENGEACRKHLSAKR